MQIEPVAYYYCPLKDKFGIPRQSGVANAVEGRIELCGKYKTPDALKGMEGFDYLWLIWGFSANKNTDWHATVRPPRLGGNKNMGVFATRSPFRPNPLGLSSVEISRIEGTVIYVKGADLMDGTPIYDIKPYVTYADSHPGAASGFVDANNWEKLEVIFPSQLQERLSRLCGENTIEAVRELLEQDPRPQYQNNPQKVYGMRYGRADVRFQVEDKTLTVKEITLIPQK